MIDLLGVIVGPLYRPMMTNHAATDSPDGSICPPSNVRSGIQTGTATMYDVIAVYRHSNQLS